MAFTREILTTTATPTSGTVNVLIGMGTPYADAVAMGAAYDSIWMDVQAPFGIEFYRKLVATGWTVDLSSHLFDVRRFGAVAEYQNSAMRGADNSAAFQAAVNAAQAAGGGLVFIPSGKYWMSSSVEISHSGVHIQGAGSRATFLYFEPTAATPAFSFNSTVPMQPTLGPCSIRDIAFRGIAEVGSSRHRKSAVHAVDTSEMHIENLDINEWQTGASYYATEGPSIGVRSSGKELMRVLRCTIFADRPVSIEKDFKQLVPQIDCDLYHIEDAYLAVQRADESAIFIDESLVIRQFTMDGANVITGGKYGIFWNDTTGGMDATFFKVSGLRHEQAADVNGYTIYISRTAGGKLFNLHLEDINLSFACGGIYLNGTISTRIMNCAYHRVEDQSTSPKALVLNAGCYMTVVDQFFIPIGTPNTPLADVSSQNVVVSTGYFAGSKSQLPAYAVYDPQSATVASATSTPQLVVGFEPGIGGSVGPTIRLHNLTTPPSSNPSAGGILYVESGALMYRGSSGTVTPVASA